MDVDGFKHSFYEVRKWSNKQTTQKEKCIKDIIIPTNYFVIHALYYRIPA